MAVAPRCEGGRGEVVDAHRDTSAGQQGEGDNGPTYRLSGRRLRLALETMTKPPPRADAHANPAIYVFEHRERSSDAEMAGGVSMVG